MLTRRDLIRFTGGTCVLARLAPIASAFELAEGKTKTLRCINIVNFIRGVEPRFDTDLLLPVQKQMELVLKYGFPATWLLQFDALVAGPFVQFLQSHMAKNQEVGFWFEMNQKLCDAAQVEWRGRPGFEWDSQPPVAFTIGYRPEERIKLADAAMAEFKRIWGKYPSSVASWNLDSITMEHLVERYGVDAFAVCRDQIATDGFTIWGAPIAGYYPSKTNCWSPAQSPHHQISSPVFRMLGQDPVYYYDTHYPLPSGRQVGEPDTMEPVWTSGKSPHFVGSFFKMIGDAPSLGFAYAQLGQENSFPWPDTADGYPMQMESLSTLKTSGKVYVETMGDSGRRFKKSFSTTPAQAQVQLEDPFENEPGEHSIWYQSRYYRANLHLKKGLPYLRDITVYSDKNPQPFLSEATREHEVEQRMPAILDGFHWSPYPGSDGEPEAGGFFLDQGKRLRLAGKPIVSEKGEGLIADLPLDSGQTLRVIFEESEISMHTLGSAESPLLVSFEWDVTKAPPISVLSTRVSYKWNGFAYGMQVPKGTVSATANGYTIKDVRGSVRLALRQRE